MNLPDAGREQPGTHSAGVSTAEHGDAAGRRSRPIGAGSDELTEPARTPREKASRERARPRGRRGTTSACVSRTHRGFGAPGAWACNSGGVRAIAWDRLGRRKERNTGWWKDAAVPASACSHEGGEKRGGGGRSRSPSAAAADGPGPTFPSRRGGILPRGFPCGDFYGLIS